MMNRRKFIQTTCLACLGGGVLPGCSSVYYAAVQLDGNRIVVKKSEFAFLKKEQPMQRQVVALKLEKMPFPIALYRLGDDEYSALYLKCTHQGCEVRPNDQLLACPCHGSEFDRQGKVLEGPAERPLKKFPIETDAENIYITLI